MKEKQTLRINIFVLINLHSVSIWYSCHILTQLPIYKRAGELRTAFAGNILLLAKAQVNPKEPAKEEKCGSPMPVGVQNS